MKLFHFLLEYLYNWVVADGDQEDKRIYDIY